MTRFYHGMSPVDFDAMTLREVQQYVSFFDQAVANGWGAIGDGG